MLNNVVLEVPYNLWAVKLYFTLPNSFLEGEVFVKRVSEFDSLG